MSLIYCHLLLVFFKLLVSIVIVLPYILKNSCQDEECILQCIITIGIILSATGNIVSIIMLKCKYEEDFSKWIDRSIIFFIYFIPFVASCVLINQMKPDTKGYVTNLWLLFTYIIGLVTYIWYYVHILNRN